VGNRKLGMETPILDRLKEERIFTVEVKGSILEFGGEFYGLPLTKQETFQLIKELTQIANTLKD
jgi:hypothetical protein